MGHMTVPPPPARGRWTMESQRSARSRAARQLRASARVGLSNPLFACRRRCRLIASQLYGVGPTDSVTFVATPAFLVAVALLATLVPVLRPTRVDPVVALRSE